MDNIPKLAKRVTQVVGDIEMSKARISGNRRSRPFTPNSSSRPAKVARESIAQEGGQLLDYQGNFTQESKPTMRYRDNFFVALKLPPSFPVDSVSTGLTELLSMPVKTVLCDSSMRCLEMRLTFGSFGKARCVRSTLAFRTDNNRQGEWRGVVWPLGRSQTTPGQRCC